MRGPSYLRPKNVVSIIGSTDKGVIFDHRFMENLRNPFLWTTYVWSMTRKLCEGKKNAYTERYGELFEMLENINGAKNGAKKRKHNHV